jgi:hypothetical protein
MVIKKEKRKGEEEKKNETPDALRTRRNMTEDSMIMPNVRSPSHKRLSYLRDC